MEIGHLIAPTGVPSPERFPYLGTIAHVTWPAPELAAAEAANGKG